MAKISVQDDDKVMDVSKPGKGKIVSTSRPIVAPITSDAPSKDDVSATVPDTEPAKPLAPSATKKVIQPLEQPESDDKEEPAETPEPAKPEEPAVEEKPSEDAAPESTDSNSDGAEAAAVDAVAEGVVAKKEAAKKAEEQAKRDAAVQELIDSKKYVVPIGHEGPHTSSRKNRTLLILLPVILLLLAAAYLLVDMQVIKTNMTLPYEFFKEESADSASDVPAQTQLADSDAGEPQEIDEEATAPSGATGNANDDERKTELKNLQVKLETYFNDNAAYPATLADLDPAPTADETTGPTSDAYVYTPSADETTYTLTANLENDSDPDADANGNYVLNSINQ